MSRYSGPNEWNLIVATIFVGVASGLIWGFDKDPNKKTYRGFGIFFFVLGFLIYGYELAKLYFAYREFQAMTGQGTVAQVVEVPQSAVVEGPQNLGTAEPMMTNVPVQNAVEPAPIVNNAPNGTVIVNNPGNGSNTGVGRRNNGRTN
jgi:hypothetical protein